MKLADSAGNRPVVSSMELHYHMVTSAMATESFVIIKLQTFLEVDDHLMLSSL